MEENDFQQTSLNNLKTKKIPESRTGFVFVVVYIFILIVISLWYVFSIFVGLSGGLLKSLSWLAIISAIVIPTLYFIGAGIGRLPYVLLKKSTPNRVFPYFRSTKIITAFFILFFIVGYFIIPTTTKYVGPEEVEEFPPETEYAYNPTYNFLPPDIKEVLTAAEGSDFAVWIEEEPFVDKEGKSKKTRPSLSKYSLWFYRFPTKERKLLYQFTYEYSILPRMEAYGKNAFALIPYANERNYIRQLFLINSGNGNVYHAEGYASKAVIGDNITAWLNEPILPNIDRMSPNNETFEIWTYDFDKDRPELLYTFDNTNPNSPNIKIGKENIIVSTYTNQLIFIDITTKKVEIVDMPNNIRLDVEYLYFIDPFIVFRSSLRSLVKYHTVNKQFEIIREAKDRWGCSYHISDIRVGNDKMIYWKEFAEWCPQPIYRIDLF